VTSELERGARRPNGGRSTAHADRWASGVHVIGAADAAETARAISIYYEAELVLSLQAAIEPLSRRAKLSRARRQQRRLARAEHLAAELEDTDPAADAALAARRPDLQEALLLAPDAFSRLPEIEARAIATRVGRDLATARNQRAEDARSDLVRSAPGLSRTTPAYRLESLATRLGDALGTAALARDRLRAAHRLVEELPGSQPGAQMSDLEHRLAARAAADAQGAARRSALKAVLLLSLLVPILLMAVSGVVPPLVAGLLGLALLPPVVEMLRRAALARRRATSEVGAAQLRSDLSTLDLLTEQEAARVDLRVARRDLVDAERALAEAEVEARTLLGATAPRDPVWIGALAKTVEDVCLAEDEAASAAAQAAEEEAGLRGALASVGLAGLDPQAALDRLYTLVQLRPVAEELLEDAVAAERRVHYRDALRAVLGGRSITSLRRATLPDDQLDTQPMLLIDDGDELLRARVLRALAEIGDEALVIVVTDDPSLWPITDDSPAEPSPPAPPPPRSASAARPEPAPPASAPRVPQERPWFMSS
jgi:hypothetical protein